MMNNQKHLRHIVKSILIIALILILSIVALAQERRFGLDENSSTKDKKQADSDGLSPRRYIPTETNRRFGLKPGESELETVVLAPQAPKSLLRIAQEFAERGQLDRAVVSYQKAITAKEKTNLAYFGLGHTLLRLNKFDESIKAFNEALTLSPNNPETYLNLGVAFYCIGQSNEAIKHYNRAIELRKGVFADAEFNLALVWFHQGEFDSAIKHYKNAIEHRPIYPAAYNNLGLVYEQIGDFDQALNNFQLAIKQKQGLYPLAHYNLGRYYFGQGKFFPEAANELETAIKQKNNFPEAFLVLGNVYLLYETISGRDAVIKAKANYEKAITLYNDYALAHENLAIAYTRLGEKKEAFKQYRRAFSFSSKYSAFLVKNLLATITDKDSFYINDEFSRLEELSQIKSNDRQIENSKEIISSLLDEYEQLPEEKKALADIHYCFGKVYMSMNNWKSAVNEFNYAVELSNNTDIEAIKSLHLIYVTLL